MKQHGERGSNREQAYGAAPPPRRPADPLTCLRCGFRVSARAAGCKNPCANCGTIYPLGDCSD